MPNPTFERVCKKDTCYGLPEELLAELLERAPAPVVVARGSDDLLYLNAKARSLWPAAGTDYSELVVLIDGKTQPLLNLFQVTGNEVGRATIPPVRVSDGNEYGVDSFIWRRAEDSAEWRVIILLPLSAGSARNDLLGDKVSRLKAIVHEFRNTLTAAKEALTFVQEGAAGELNTEQHRFVNSVMEDLEQLVRAMSDLASLWATSASVLRIISRPVDIRRVLEQSTLHVKSMANKGGISLHVEISDLLPPLSGDHELLVQAIRNVLTNALQHTLPGGEIRVRAFPVNTANRATASPDVHREWPARNQLEHADGSGSVVIEVHDSGMGVRPEDRERIFRPFERGQLNTAYEGASGSGGMGLGLTIAREIAWTHGGTLQVRDGLNKGSCFVFRFPLSQDNARSWMARVMQRAIDDVRSLRIPLASVLFQFQADDGDSGEHLLSSVQQLAAKNLRPSDTVLAIDGRLLLLMRGATRSAAYAVVDRVLCSPTEMLRKRGVTSDKCDMLLGVAIYPEDGDSAEAVLERAEDDLHAPVTVADPRSG